MSLTIRTILYTLYMPRGNIAKERKLAEKIEKAAASFRERRIAEKLSQARLAESLGVTPNTVARWERCEVPIPQWVARLQAAQAKIKELQTSLVNLTEEKKKLGQTIKFKDIEIKFLKAGMTIQKAQKHPGHAPQVVTAEEVYRDLVKAFHPDRNPQHLEAMKTINEIYQRIRRV